MTPAPNPAGRGPRRSSFRRPFSPMWFGLSLFGLLLIANLVASVLRQGETIDYSQFKTLLGQGRVVEADVAKEAITGTYLNGENRDVKFTTNRVDDPKLAEELQAQKVKFRGEPDNRWVTELLSWVVPFLLILALWLFFIRRMGGAEGGIMSFARSRAKIYADDDVKVAFVD